MVTDPGNRVIESYVETDNSAEARKAAMRAMSSPCAILPIGTRNARSLTMSALYSSPDSPSGARAPGSRAR